MARAARAADAQRLTRGRRQIVVERLFDLKQRRAEGLAVRAGLLEAELELAAAQRRQHLAGIDE